MSTIYAINSANAETCPVIQPVKPKSLVHPGGVFDPKKLQALKKLDATTVSELIKITPLDYKTQAIANVDIGPYGSGDGHKEFIGDGEMTYKAAVAYLATGNESYAKLAVDILNTWSTKCTIFKGSNAPLEAAWGTAAMVKAAELLKYTWPGWDRSGVEARYNKWLDALILPYLIKPLGWDQRQNWGLSICEARLMTAIFRDKNPLYVSPGVTLPSNAGPYVAESEFLWAQKEYQHIHAGFVVASGQTGEFTRDCYHCQFGVGSLIQIPEILWHQGIDLYSYRDSLMYKSLEFNALPLLGKKPPNAVGETKDVWYLPCGWHIGYKHYNGRKGLPMPNTAAVIKKNPYDVFTFHWGLGHLV